MNSREFVKNGGIVGACILMLLIGINATLSAKDNKADDDMITTIELYDAFKNDRASAVEQYGKKTMTIKRFVVYTGPDVYGLPSVELSEVKDGKSGILCVLPFSDYLKLRKVSKGDEVLITGEVRNLYEKGDQIVVKECKIVENSGK